MPCVICFQDAEHLSLYSKGLGFFVSTQTAALLGAVGISTDFVPVHHSPDCRDWKQSAQLGHTRVSS